MINRFFQFLTELKTAKDEDTFREIWHKYTNSIKVGSTEDYWITKLLDRYGTPANIFMAIRKGEELVTEGDLKNWAIERAGKYVFKEE